jgi:L-cysteine/cystine lyase
VSDALAEARRALPCLAGETYLNTGGAGPLPVPVAEAVRAALAAEVAAGRMSTRAVLVARERQARLRAALARLVGAAVDEIGLFGNTTEAMNAVVWGIDWSPGDEAVTTDAEHQGLLAPLRSVALRRGVRVHVVPVGDGGGALEAVIGARVGRRTRLVALSHVAWGTGALMDVAGAARAARSVGALTLVDGAQGAGAVPVDVAALGADAYALPAQKWLLGPQGLGALWLSRGTGERVSATFVGDDSGTAHGPDGTFVPHGGARRLETATAPETLVAGWIAALDWLEALGLPGVHARIAERRARCARLLARVPGVRVLEPARAAGLVSFTIDGRDPGRAAAALARRGVIVRWVPRPYALRASTGFFTDDGDLVALRDAVRGVALGRD